MRLIRFRICCWVKRHQLFEGSLDHHRARRIGARRSLALLPASNRSLRACASLRCSTSRRAHLIPQALPPPTQGYRLQGKRSLSLPRKASLGATQTRPRRPGVASTPHTPHNEKPKSPARSAARAPPAPLRHPRPTSSSYSPPLPLAPAAIRGSPSLSAVSRALLVYPVWRS